MKRILSIVAVVMAAVMSLPLTAQTTLTQTTLSAAVSSTTANRVVVASATGIAAGTRIFVDREMMQVQSVSGTALTVTRGLTGTVAGKHASGAAVYAGAANLFASADPIAGYCDSTAELATPRVVPLTGSVFTCSNSVWTRIVHQGFPTSPSGTLFSQYTASGALTIAPGIHVINGTTLAMTLANPTVAQNGMVMIITSQNASAHTLTYTAGFGGGTTARDVGTFGGAIGDGIVIFANAGTWWVISTRNVTIA